MHSLLLTFVLLLLRALCAAEPDSHDNGRRPDAYGEPHHKRRHPVPQLDLPASIKKVILNVGCNMDPPMPPEDDESVAVIGVEPVLKTAARIPLHPRLFIITAAIADSPHFATMNLYNAGGLSSSLAPVANQGEWWKKYTDVNPQLGLGPRKNPEFEKARHIYQPTTNLVPVLPLRMLIDSIPERIEITMLHTDMQGHDFMAVRSAGDSIYRIGVLQTEVWLDANTYKGVNNSLEKDWKPYMDRMGFTINETRNMGKEADIFWVKDPARVPKAYQ
ncbi:hypothetical protein B484DRAFT_396999 [Ochromonadaceae sp. CCMP2298]|nr:hypothetical protein B484DRAFT_396999 [Ochromonadaceae sp. CCMP2298]|mmetsp:Transcript_10880/g.24121  ORF Transcript_10880/g.24121 Transcript_10880/m.24121 type:complete len:275 (-) Transcript_10880:117-941(-)